MKRLAEIVSLQAMAQQEKQEFDSQFDNLDYRHQEMNDDGTLVEDAGEGPEVAAAGEQEPEAVAAASA